MAHFTALSSWATSGGWFDGSAYYSSLMVSASSLPLPTGAAQEHAASNSPNACRLSDGTNWLSSLPVTGTFWQSTQPVSGSVSVTNFPASQAVTGTFWQSTQPVSLASMPTTAVTGTFWQTTQPVSGTFWQTTQPVSGTFWQSTQPVSIASMPSTPVTGTFWQSTQPVSIASMPSTPVTGTFWQGTQPVSGTFWQSTQPVSIASMPSTPVTGTFWQSTQPVSLASTVTVSQATTGANPCMNPASTLVSATGATSGTAAVQIVALSGSTKIYLCSLNVMGVSGTTPTFSLVQGTGSNCATGQTKVVQPWTTAAGTLYPFANPIAVGAAGNALCYLDTGTTPIQNYTLTYVQQ